MNVVKHVLQLSRETATYGISNAIIRLAAVILIPLYTRLLTPGEYGIMALVDTISALLIPLLVLGLDNSSALWFYENNDTDHRKCTISSWFWCQIVVSLLVTAMLFLLAPKISILLFHSSAYTSLIQLALMTIPVATFQKITGNWLQYQRRALSTSLFTAFNVMSKIVITILFVLVWRWGLTGIYCANLAAAILVATAAMIVLRNWISPAYFSLNRLKDMLRFGLPLVPASIAYWVTVSFDKYMLQLFRGSADVGLYSLAATLALGLGLFTSAFQMAYGPFAFSIHKEKDSGLAYSKILSLFVWFGCFLCTCFSLFATPILHTLATKEYIAASSCVPFLVFSSLLVGTLDIASIGSAIVKKSVPVAKSILLCASVNIMLNLIFIPAFGKEGAAFSLMMSYIFSVGYLFSASQKNYFIPYQFTPVIACFAVSGVLIIVDRLFNTSGGVAANMLRIGMCLLFIPLALYLKIIKLQTIKYLFSKNM